MPLTTRQQRVMLRALISLCKKYNISLQAHPGNGGYLAIENLKVNVINATEAHIMNHMDPKKFGCIVTPGGIQEHR